MVIPSWEIVGHTSRPLVASKGQLVGRNSPKPGPSNDAVAVGPPKNGMKGKKTGSRMTSTSSAIPSAAISATSLVRAGTSWSIDGPVESFPHAPRITAQVKAPKRISLVMVVVEWNSRQGSARPPADKPDTPQLVPLTPMRLHPRTAGH